MFSGTFRPISTCRPGNLEGGEKLLHLFPDLLLLLLLFNNAWDHQESPVHVQRTVLPRPQMLEMSLRVQLSDLRDTE